MKEVDPSSGEVEDEGYEDEYQLEDLEITAADYIAPQVWLRAHGAWGGEHM